MSLFTGSNEAAILSAFTGDLAAVGVKVRCEIGADEDARRGAPPRITWVPQGGDITHPEQQLAEMQVAHEDNPEYLVHFWGASYHAAKQLMYALHGVLFRQRSPNAYELGSWDVGSLPETPNESKGFEIVQTIRLLRIPIPAQLFRAVTITSATATGQILGAAGENPASDAPTLTKEFT